MVVFPTFEKSRGEIWWRNPHGWKSDDKSTDLATWWWAYFHHVPWHVPSQSLDWPAELNVKRAEGLVQRPAWTSRWDRCSHRSYTAMFGAKVIGPSEAMGPPQGVTMAVSPGYWCPKVWVPCTKSRLLVYMVRSSANGPWIPLRKEGAAGRVGSRLTKQPRVTWTHLPTFRHLSTGHGMWLTAIFRHGQLGSDRDRISVVSWE